MARGAELVGGRQAVHLLGGKRNNDPGYAPDDENNRHRFV
jgi:hypothetical protein